MNGDPEAVEDRQSIHYPESNLGGLGKTERQYVRERLADLLDTVLQEKSK